jgi:capsular exopolysaccharide synthesis family protein
MSRISEALNKAAEENKAQKTESRLSAALPEAKEAPLKEWLGSGGYTDKPEGGSRIDPRVVAYFGPGSVISEQYRSLRTNIMLNNASRQLKTIAVCSSLQGEGKTLTAVNLAITLARDPEIRVILVDCDLRGGIAHQLLSLNPAAGLSDVLSGAAALESAFCRTAVSSLIVLPRGGIPHNPSELLSSRKMKRMLEELKTQFDYIILDSPPVVPLTDGCVLGSQADGVLFVVRAHKTPRRLVKQARNMLEHVHAKILGFVLTQIQEKIPEYTYRDTADARTDSPENTEE